MEETRIRRAKVQNRLKKEKRDIFSYLLEARIAEIMAGLFFGVMLLALSMLVCVYIMLMQIDKIMLAITAVSMYFSYVEYRLGEYAREDGINTLVGKYGEEVVDLMERRKI